MSFATLSPHPAHAHLNSKASNPVFWEDLRFPATSISIGVATHPALDTTIPGRTYRDANNDTQIIIAQLPHSWLEDSLLKPHIHWQKATAAEGAVVWELKYVWSSINAANATEVTIKAHTPTTNSDLADVHMITPLPDIAATGRKISDMLLMKLTRLGNDDDDTFAGSARLLEFDIHFQVSSPGSRQLFSK
jgi:hypothetical protein